MRNNTYNTPGHITEEKLKKIYEPFRAQVFDYQSWASKIIENAYFLGYWDCEQRYIDLENAIKKERENGYKK